MIAEFISTEDSRWKQVLAQTPHDFYHLPEYVKFAARHEGGAPFAFYAEDGEAVFLVPLLIREIPEGLGAPSDWYDATTPYGYPTPVISSNNDSFYLGYFLKKFKEIAADQGIITAFFRLHPLLPLPTDVLSKYGSLVKHGQTVYIDLSLPISEIRKQFRKGHRYDIRKLKQKGFTVKINDWSLYQEFITIYNMNMRRVSADEFYFFSNDYFYDFASALGKNVHLCVVLSPEGKVASAALFTTVNSIVQYHLSGTADSFLYAAPSKLLIDFVCKWAKKNGNSVLHLGGGVGGNSDSLFKFKAGFSKRRSDFFTFRMVLDKAKYEFLNQKLKAIYGCKLDTNFFPQYRQCMNIK